jgi:hypothetical protein
VFAALVDHLWQSVCVFFVLWLGATLARGVASNVRLWMWRIAGLKFLIPFSVLFAMGGWLGFPVKHSEETVPDFVVAPLAALKLWVAPAHATNASMLALAACAGVLLLAAATCVRTIYARHEIERWRRASEDLRRKRDPDDVAPGLGFVRGLLFTAVALVATSGPLLAGAVDDRLWRHELLLENSSALRDAQVVMKPAAPGMGSRVRVSADGHGVYIRNATIRDLAALAYGVNRFFVRGDHFYESGETDWLIDARYDIAIAGTIREPNYFDTYALRRPVTRMLAQRHGLEIYVNSECQPPCGRYGVAMPEKDSL